MTQVFSSPGVYTQEIDNSFRAPTPGATPSPAVIGFSKKGMAFRPITVGNGEFTSFFGGYKADFLGGLAVKKYFDVSPNRPLSFTRVLGTGSASQGKAIFLAFPTGAGVTADAVCRTGNQVGAILRTVADNNLDYRITGTPTNFSLTSSDGSVSLTNLSLDSSDKNNFIGNKLAYDPLNTSQYSAPSLYIDTVFEYATDDLDGWGVSAGAVDAAGYAPGFASATGNGSYDSIVGGFSHAYTPWVVSQEFGGKVHKLFRFHTLSHGDYENSNYKIGIAAVNTDSDEYPTFTVILGTAWDTSGRTKGNIIDESYGSWTVSLNPNSANYLPKVIGDQYIQYDMSSTPPVQTVKGSFRSNEAMPKIRVEMGVVAPKASRPSGFEGVSRIIPTIDKLTVTAGSNISFDSTTDRITAATDSFGFINAGQTITVGGTSAVTTALLATAPENTNGDNVITVADGSGFYVGSPIISDPPSYIPAGSKVSVVATNDITIVDANDDPVNITLTEDISITAYNNDGTYTVVSSTNTTIDVAELPSTITSGDVITITEVDQDSAQIPSLPYKTNHVRGGNLDTGVYMGVDYDEVGIIARMKSTITMTNGSLSADKGLLLYSKVSETTSSSADMAGTFTLVDLNSDLVSADTDAYGNGKLQFSVPFFGGNDAFDPRVDKLLATNASDTTSITGSFERAISILSNPDTFTFNLLAIPGVHSSGGGNLVQRAIDMVTARQDAFYIMDIASGNSTTAAGANTTLSQAITEAGKYDTSFAATYYPWVRMTAPVDGSPRIDVPPSVLMLGVFGFNDKVRQPWYAPAGFSRGALDADVELITKLNQTNRDTLYDNNINPLASFAGQGAAVFGQKTLQKRESVLDRISVRRMLLEVKRAVSRISRLYLFEPNDVISRSTLLRSINDYLSGVQQAQGLTEFRAVLDESTTTPDLVDRNIMKGKIFLKPTSAAEVILFDLTVSPQGATIDAA